MAKYTTDPDAFWWKTSKKRLFSVIFDTVNFIREAQSYRTQANLRNLRLYGNSPLVGLSGGWYARVPTSAPGEAANKVTLNIVHSMVSTIVSKIIKNRPRATFLTTGGDFSMQRKAKLLNRFLQGMFYETEAYQVGDAVVRDACIFGTGFMKIFEEEGKIKCERVFPEEIMVDDREALFNAPRQMFQRKVVTREVLVAQFPEKEKFIRMASRDEEWEETLNEGYDLAKTSDQVAVIEAWHLPSSVDGNDGRHVISVDNAVLSDEPYEKSYFPFVKLEWSNRSLGYFGQGIAEQLTGLQIQINRLLNTIRVAMDLVSVPKVFIEAGSKVSKSHLNNEIGGIITYSGTMPEYRTAQAVGPEMFTHLDRLYQRAYEIVGVSQLSASAKKPSGIDSGRALREYHDIESERFMSFAKDHEKMYLDAAKIMIETARDIYMKTGAFKVRSFNRSLVEQIDWKDIDLEEDKYVMQMWPVSMLPATPAGRLQTIQEMMTAGLISREDGLSLLEFPDLKEVQDLQNAERNDINMIIELLIDKGVYVSPEPFTNLPLAIKTINSAYLKAKTEGAPDDRLDLCRRFISDAMALLAPPPEEMPQPQAMGPALAPQAEEAAMAQGASLNPNDLAMATQTPTAEQLGGAA